jgi:two-component system chemotaxis response regulator CheB
MEVCKYYIRRLSMNERSSMDRASGRWANPISSPRLVVLVASAGGLAPIAQVLHDLPADFPAAVAVVMHRGTAFPDRLIEVLQKRTRLSVRSARDGDPLQAGVVYVCPPGVHMVAERSVRLIQGPHLQYVRPSADLMLQSAAQAYAAQSIAVIFSGSGSDGAVGTLAVARCGGSVIVQHPESCDYKSMPAAAMNSGAAQASLPPGQIAAALQRLVSVPVQLESNATFRGTDHLTRVMLVDDHKLLLDGLHVLIDGENDMKVVGRVEDGARAVQRASELEPDVVVMDICMPGMDGIQATREIVARLPAAKVVALSAQSDASTINRVLQAGARSYITKDRAYDELAGAIRRIERDQPYFSADIAGLVDTSYVGAPGLELG